MKPLLTYLSRPVLNVSAIKAACLIGAGLLLAGEVSAQVTAPVVYRLKAGGPAMTTSRGTFAADQYYTTAGSIFINGSSIAGTTDDALYQSERFSANGQLGYALPVSNGTYSVVLHFAEIYWTRVGQRVFDIRLENNLGRAGYDIVREVGALTATTQTFVTTVTDGVLNLNLSVPYGAGGIDQAKLSALEVFSGNILSSRDPAAAKDGWAVDVYPNPTAGRLTVACTVTEAQTATLTLADQLGRTVREQVVRLQAGENQVPMSAGQLANGLYQFTLRTANGQARTQKLLVQAD